MKCQMWHQFAEFYDGSDARSKMFSGEENGLVNIFWISRI
jgi:hypothetical protein